MFDTRFQAPFSLIISGSSGSGKSYYIKEMIKNNKIHPMPCYIEWRYAEIAPEYTDLTTNIKYVKGIPTSLDYLKKNSLLILDDLMEEIKDKKARIRDCPHVLFAVQQNQSGR